MSRSSRPIRSPSPRRPLQSRPKRMATRAPEAERENEATTANQPIFPLSNLDIDTAIRLRWALRDIKAKRTKLTPVSPSDLKALIEMGLLEMRDDAPTLTNEGHQALREQ